MAILYLIEQGAYVRKTGTRLVVEKKGKLIQWVHGEDLEQVLIFGNIQFSAGAINFLLAEGIDTVFLSTYGKYKGRLLAHLGKNIELRRMQFRSADNEPAVLSLARCFVAGKLRNYRVLLRRHNRDRGDEEVENATHRIRSLISRLDECTTLDELRGFEGKGSFYYFRGLGKIIRKTEFTFEKRTRRPPRDPVNALLSFGYTLLFNAVHTAVCVVGLDPYLGCLHGMDYGRPSLVLDLMEEWRPVLVDSVALRCINRNILALRDFHFQQEVDLPPEGEELESPGPGDYPVLLTGEGLKKYIHHFEQQLRERVLYQPQGVQLQYRSVITEQVRLLARHIKGEEDYVPFEMK
jgi:CRISPR-associated protein Cas1